MRMRFAFQTIAPATLIARTTAANVCTLQTEVLLDAHALNMLEKKGCKITL